GRTFGHTGFVRHLLLLRVLDCAELILADGLRLEGFGGRYHIFQRLRDRLGLTLSLGAVEIEQIAVSLGVGRERPFGGAARRDLVARRGMAAPARENLL